MSKVIIHKSLLSVIAMDWKSYYSIYMSVVLGGHGREFTAFF